MVSPALAYFSNLGFLYTHSPMDISCGKAQGHHPCLQKCPVWLVGLGMQGHVMFCPHGLLLGCSWVLAPLTYIPRKTIRTSRPPNFLWDGSSGAGCEQSSWKTQLRACRKQGCGKGGNTECYVELCGMGSFCKVENIKDAPILKWYHRDGSVVGDT